MRYTFPKRIHLCRKREIDQLFQTGQFERRGVLRVKYCQNSQEESRFLIAVKRKVGNAVYRNRVKRLIREAIRLQRSQLQGSYDIALMISHAPQLPLKLNYLQHKIASLFRDLTIQHQQTTGNASHESSCMDNASALDD